RNAYLSEKERKLAPALHRALRGGVEAVTHGIHDVAAVERLMRKLMDETPEIDVDYLVLVDPLTFEAPADVDRDPLVAGAVRLGRTRLIDNILIPRRAIE